MDKIGNFINDGLAERLHRLDTLTVLVENVLAMPVKNRIWPLLRNRRLILLTDDSHVATQARFMQKTLCKHISNELNLKLGGVDIKLIALPLASFGKKSSNVGISEQTAETLQSIAAEIEDEELSSALMRLAKVAKIIRPV